MSAPARERAIVDAGLKAFAFDSGPPLVLRRARARLREGLRRARRARGRAGRDAAARSAIACGSIPGHCDPTVNLYDWIVGVRGARVECLWPVAARGALA